MSSDRGVLARIFGPSTGGLLGGGLPANFVGPVQPPVQASPITAPAASTLFQNPAFISALSRFGQRLATPTQPGEASGLVQGFGGFAPDLITGLQQQQALQQQQSQQEIIGRLREAQISQAQAGTAQTLAATERLPAARALERRKQALAEKKFDLDADRFDRELETGGLSQEDIFKRGTKLRGEFTNLSKDFTKQRDAFGRIEAVAAQIKKDPSAAGVGDIALIFNFMKVQDPGSTVREGEFATAENSAGLVPKLRNQYNKILQGDRLTAKQRDDFVNTSKTIFDRSSIQHNKRIETFTGLATRLGVDKRNVIIDLGLAENIAQTEQQAENIPTGQSIITPEQARAELKRRGL